MNFTVIRYISFFIFLIMLGCKPHKNQFLEIKGNVFGTTFIIKHSDIQQRDFSKEIAEIFNNFNNALSTYHQNSTISLLNNGLLEVSVKSDFKNVFLLAKKIHQKTNGYFDPTIGKMVNPWGFGPLKNEGLPTKKEVDSLMQYVGFEKISLKNDKIRKQDPNIFIDFNAIAKGYGVDLIGYFLERKGVENYLIEIGGEIRVRGKNNKGTNWFIGIDDPNVDGTRSYQKIAELNNESMATSGNYRKFKIDSITGKKITHTLNPKTGCPAKTDLLSVSA